MRSPDVFRMMFSKSRKSSWLNTSSSSSGPMICDEKTEPLTEFLQQQFLHDFTAASFKSTFRCSVKKSRTHSSIADHRSLSFLQFQHISAEGSVGQQEVNFGTLVRTFEHRQIHALQKSKTSNMQKHFHHRRSTIILQIPSTAHPDSKLFDVSAALQSCSSLFLGQLGDEVLGVIGGLRLHGSPDHSGHLARLSRRIS